MRSSGRFLGAWLAYITFVVYGSLLPFDFQPYALDAAIEAFRHIPFLKLGIESRADWVANGVLYVPVGLLTVKLLINVFNGHARPLAVVLAIAFSTALAIAVEFTQLFFPPRTVSQNDLMAECIGAVIGALVAPSLEPWVERLLGAWQSGGQRLAQRLLEAYAVVYFLLCLFPYDLLLSAQEWQAKVGSDAWGWLLADSSLQRGWVAGLLLGVEVLLAAPYGVLLASRRGARRSGVGACLVLGCGLGLAIEVGQMAMASGITQGASVLTRGVGVALGAWCWQLWVSRGIAPIKSALGRHGLALGLIFLVALLGVNGWFARPVLDMAAVSEKWTALHLMPLYYHYFTTEAKALFSLGSVALMYLPVALIGWSWQWRSATTLTAVAGLASVVEAGKLLLEGLHPDPTNVIIALVACWTALRLLALIERPHPAGQHAISPVPPSPCELPAGTADLTWRAWTLTGPVMVFAAWSAWSLPALVWPVLAVLVGAAAMVWQRPVHALAIVPAALPVFDLAPWTGRFFWDEFDLLMLVVLAIGWHRTTPPRPASVHGLAPLLTVLLALFGLSLAISALRGLMPWQRPDVNSVISYYSSLNGLRIAKGAVWAAGFIALYRRLNQTDTHKQRVFAWGMSFGLLLTVAVVVWERLAFVSLFDFSAIYRVTGPFSAMHTGGAYIECYLALAIAFLLWLVLRTPRPQWRWLGALLLLGATYALMVTYSRNGYAALLVVVLVMLGAAVIRPAGDGPTGARHPRLTALLVAATILAVAAPVLLGPFALQRLAQVGRDQAIRVAHWQDALQMRNNDWPTTIFGVGLGRFPATHYWLSAEPVHAAPYGLSNDKTGPFLRLGTGAAVYVEQFVNVRPGERYRLSLDLRSDSTATLGVALCEKWMLTSAACTSVKLDANASPAGWHHANVTLSTERWLPQAWYRSPPVKLAFFNSGGPSSVDVANIRLETESGTALLVNGNFNAGLDHWFFSTDVDPPWHIHSLPVTILFEQGWLGLLAGAAAMSIAIGAAALRTWRGDSVAAPVLAALLAMMVSGVANTLIDAPRFLTLLLVLMWLGSHENIRKADRPPQAADIGVKP